MRNYTRTIQWNNAEIDVSFDYEEGDPGVHTYPNGDPGYPPSPEELIVSSVRYKGKDITDLFDEDDITRMEEILIKDRGRDYDGD
jgi:hypothetical protein